MLIWYSSTPICLQVEASRSTEPYLDGPVLAIPVQCIHDVAADVCDVHGGVEGADDAGVAVRQAVLDVVEGGVEQHAGFVPGCTLDSDCLVHRLRWGKTETDTAVCSLLRSVHMQGG